MALCSNPEIVSQTSVPEVVLTAEQLIREKVNDLCSEDGGEEEEEESVIVNEEAEKSANENSVNSTTEKMAAESEITTLEMIQNENVPPSRSEQEMRGETEAPASYRWMENEESMCCMCCGKRFGLFRRRHVGVGGECDV